MILRDSITLGPYTERPPGSFFTYVYSFMTNIIYFLPFIKGICWKVDDFKILTH